jgi:putative hydrolase of the HAD superfamily
MRGADPASLGDLRYDCARELAAGLEDPPPIETLVEVLLAALRFRVLDDAPPALTRLAERGVRLAVVSNWDCSLAGILTNLGIAGRFEVIISSAEVGAAKPAPEPFLAALECMGVPPSREVLHCGDSPEADGAGAEAAGITPVIVDREGGAGAGPGDAGYRVIRRLTELADDL